MSNEGWERFTYPSHYPELNDPRSVPSRPSLIKPERRRTEMLDHRDRELERYLDLDRVGADSDCFVLTYADTGSATDGSPIEFDIPIASCGWEVENTNSRFTPENPGIYLVKSSVEITATDNPAVGTVLLSIKKYDSSSVLTSDIEWLGPYVRSSTMTAATAKPTAIGFLFFSAGDYIEVELLSEDATAPSVSIMDLVALKTNCEICS